MCLLDGLLGENMSEKNVVDKFQAKVEILKAGACHITCDNENDIVNIVIRLTLLKSKTVGGRV